MPHLPVYSRYPELTHPHTTVHHLPLLLSSPCHLSSAADARMMHGWAPSHQVNVVKMLKSVVSGKRKLFGAELGTIGNQPNQPNPHETR